MVKRTKPLHVYEIEDGETHWYVATSERDAFKLYAEQHFLTQAQLKTSGALASQCADDREMTIMFEDENGEYNDENTRTQTCAQWAKEAGRGFLSTTPI